MAMLPNSSVSMASMEVELKSYLRMMSLAT